ncbi:MAG: hypothetical protein JNM69_36580 [Archangium sp.]|nr:hypothetical protein [Archangium sp.]
MATIERHEYTLETLHEARRVTAKALDRCDTARAAEAHALVILLLKGIGRVREALLESVAFFDRARAEPPSVPVVSKDLIVAGCRASVMAAIATPEVPVAAVRESLGEVRRMCERRAVSSNVVDQLEFELDATLDPERDWSSRSRALTTRFKKEAYALNCSECATLRFAWRHRAHLTQAETARLVELHPGCLADRGHHLKAEFLLRNRRLVAADAQLQSAIAALSIKALPVPLLQTGLAIARARRSRVDVVTRLTQLDAALVDYEYPYDEFEVRLEVIRLASARLLPRRLPPRLLDNERKAAVLAHRIDARAPSSQFRQRLADELSRCSKRTP